MRLVIARCSVDYAGRLTAHLPSATRLIMVKADGCVAIHADGGAYKPLNWMNAPNKVEEQEDRWIVTGTRPFHRLSWSDTRSAGKVLPRPTLCPQSTRMGCETVV